MQIAKLKNTAAPIILIYGGEGEGKTTLASKLPKSVWMPLERGLPAGVEVDAIDGLLTFAHIIEALRELCKDPNGYKTLVVDTLDSLEPMLIEHLCGLRNWKDIEQPSFGKGWVALDDIWRSFLKGITTLRDRHGVTIVMVAHQTIETINDPRAPSYTTFLPKLHKRGRALVLDACDVVGFLGRELKVYTDEQGFTARTRAASSTQRLLFVEGNAAFTAKNRFGMPPKLPIPPDFDIGQLTQYWTGDKA
jgi:hypothetical protein